MDILWIFSGVDLERLREELNGARTLRVALDAGTLKYKVNEYEWTVGLEPEHIPTFRATRVCKHCGKPLDLDQTRPNGWITEDGQQFCEAFSVGVYEHTPVPDLYGHCDTCGAPCDEEGCTRDRRHLAALTEDRPRCRVCHHPVGEPVDSPGMLVHLNQDGIDHDQDADHVPIREEI